MKANIIAIGNSKEVRIPKALLELCAFGNNVEITVEDNRIVLAPIVKPRNGWDAAFQNMARLGDDKLLDLPPTEFEKDDHHGKSRY